MITASIMVNDQNGVFGHRTRWGAMLTIAAVLTLPPDAASQDKANPPPTTPDAHQDETQSREIAQQLVNPVSSVMSFPFVNNLDFRLGAKQDGFRYTMNFQPLLPFKLNDHWSLISRTIAPFVQQSDVVGSSSQTGLGDFLQSFFLSPRKTKPFMWGAGPALLIPTATNTFLGTGKLSVGPTLVILHDQGGWTYGVLTNHVWSIAGDHARADVSSTFLQPFLAYTTRSGWTFNANSDSTKNWSTGKWGVPVNIFLTKLVHVAGQPINMGGGARCWATAPPGGPQGCGVRINITLGSSRLSL
jgi:hypothetical protein